MPALSRFYGIIIKMYFLPKEHNPPHIHVMYAEEMWETQDIHEIEPLK